MEKNDERPFPGIKETIDILRRSRIAPERVIIVYNPEGQPGTPAQELRDLVANSRKAKQIAQTTARCWRSGRDSGTCKGANIYTQSWRRLATFG